VAGRDRRRHPHCRVGAGRAADCERSAEPCEHPAEPDEPSPEPTQLSEPQALPSEPQALPCEPQAQLSEPQALPSEQGVRVSEQEAPLSEPQAQPFEPQALLSELKAPLSEQGVPAGRPGSSLRLGLLGAASATAGVPFTSPFGTVTNTGFGAGTIPSLRAEAASRCGALCTSICSASDCRVSLS
jgi:hypothetical protein